MSPLRRSPVPIASAAEPSLWWAEVLSEPVVDGRTLSLFWLDSGHRLGRVLTSTGVPPRPEPPVVDVVRQLRGTLVAEGPLYTRAHTALALSRPDASSIDDDDEA